MRSDIGKIGSWKQSEVGAYLLAVLLTGLTLGLRMLLSGKLQDVTVIEFTVPILLSAYLGGVGPGLLSTALSALGVGYFLQDPIREMRITSDLGWWETQVLVASGILISFLCGMVRRTRIRLQKSLDEIEAAKTAVESAEAALGESEDLFGKAFRLSPDCLAISRLGDDTMMEVNEAVSRLWGEPVEWIIGKTAMEFVEWVDPADMAEFSVRLRNHGECLNWRTVLRIHQREAREFDLSCRIINFRGETCVLTVMREVSERLRAERAVSELAAIVESSDDAIIGKDFDGIVRSWNAGAEKLFGYTAAEMVGKSIMKVVPPDRVDQENELLSRVSSGDVSRHRDTVRRCKDGTFIDVLLTASPIRDADQKITGISAVAHDITERKRGEAALLASESRYRALFEYAPDGMLIVAASGEFQDANTSACQMLGFPREDLAGLRPRDIVSEEDALHLGPALGIVRAWDSYHAEWRFRRKDGSSFPADVLARRMPDGNLLVVLRDVSERQKLEQAMSASEERFRTMANTIPQLAWIAAADGSISWYNDRWYEYTGLAPINQPGREWEESIPLDSLSQVHAKWTQLIQIGAPFDLEFPIIGTDGHERAFLTKVQPLRDREGTIVEWIGTNTDVEELKQAEERVRTLNADLERRVTERTAQLETANKELEAFSYSVSHDLRSPLRAIDGFSQAVLEDFGDVVPEECRRYLQTIRDGAQKMGALIDDLLAFSRLSRLPLNTQRIDTAALVRSVIHDVELHNPASQVELAVGPLEDCVGDPALLRQVWVNLIANAFKYTSKKEQPRVEIGCEKIDGTTAFYVADNGTGFDMRYADKIFGVFQRLHRAEDFDGTGVGLAIVQRVVHRHGGHVWAQAEPDQGATFHFTLTK